MTEHLDRQPEQIAIMHLFDRLRHVEVLLQREILQRERRERTERARMSKLQAEIERLKAGQR